MKCCRDHTALWRIENGLAGETYSVDNFLLETWEWRQERKSGKGFLSKVCVCVCGKT